MTVFVLGCIALIAFTLIALLWPLWREARGWALALLIAVPVSAGLIYHSVGTPAVFGPIPQPVESAQHSDANLSLEQALTSLRSRLQQNPDDLEGWMMLGRTLRFQQDHPGARDAFMRAYALAPDSPDVMVETAEAMIMATERPLIEGEPLQLIQRALAIDPDQQRGLLLLGAHHIQSGRPAEGLVHWERLLELAPEESLPALRERIAEVRAEAGMAPLSMPEPVDDAPALEIEITIAPELADRVPANAVLFVLARPVDAPGAPFAAKRLQGGAFPRTVTLGNADSPMPSARLFDQPQVRLIARVSIQGVANAQPGDLEGALDVSPEPGARIALRIDRVVE